MATNPTALGSAFTSSLSTAVASIPAAGTPEQAYKAFMDQLGKGFLDAVGDALGAAVGALGGAHAATPNPNFQLIIDQLQKGGIIQLTFPTPITAPTSNTVGVSSKTVVGAAAGAAPLGGSVSVGGSWSF